MAVIEEGPTTVAAATVGSKTAVLGRAVAHNAEKKGNFLQNGLFRCTGSNDPTMVVVDLDLVALDLHLPFLACCFV